MQDPSLGIQPEIQALLPADAPKNSVIPTEATDSFTVRCAVEGPPYFAFPTRSVNVTGGQPREALKTETDNLTNPPSNRPTAHLSQLSKPKSPPNFPEYKNLTQIGGGGGTIATGKASVPTRNPSNP